MRKLTKKNTEIQLYEKDDADYSLVDIRHIKDGNKGM